jgi:GGDEF domain-containing protein
MEILDTLSTILIVDNEATLNEKAKEEFKDIDISTILTNIDFSKNIEFAYVCKDLYAVNVLKSNYVLLIFTKITDAEHLLKTTTKYDKNNDIEMYSKDVLKEFLDKFLALKKRYGGFHIKFLYLKIDFTLNFKSEVEQQALNSILKYTLGITRSSDVVGQINQKSFAIILTNPSTEGANIITDKINNYISQINLKNGKRVIEVHGATVNELFLLKHINFDEIINAAEEKSRFITHGSKLIEVI